MENAIGKLMYIGKNFKGELENGKIYDCLDLSFGQVKIIDDTNEAFWYSATNPGGDSGKDHSAWAVIEDNTPDQLLTEFVSGNKSRTQKDSEEERGKILAEVSFSFSEKGRAPKQRDIERKYVEETPERKKYRDQQMSSFARSLARMLDENVRKYNGFDNYMKTFDSQPSDTYQYELNGKKYNIVRNEKSWSIYRVTKNESTFVERVFLNRYPKINDIRVYMATSGKY